MQMFKNVLNSIIFLINKETANQSPMQRLFAMSAM